MTEKTGTTYEGKHLKKKPVNLDENWAGAHAEKMKDEDVVDESETAASSTVSKEGTAVMGKLAKAMNPLCSIYSLQFRIWVEKHKPYLKKV